ncbi:MAG: DEAD/DEAH box helicase [Candidatus Nanopelagicales bacterium]
MAKFAELPLPTPLVEALRRQGLTETFPIQAATLPDSLSGRDVLGRGRTGSGKTLAFALPLLTALANSHTPAKPKRPTGLVLAPTRELAEQIAAVLTPLARSLDLTVMTIFGGVSAGKQISTLRRGVDIVVACPGRLNDHMRSGNITLDRVQVCVVDEADHMADLGFLPDVRRILDATPSGGQRLLFSATLDRQIDVLVRRYLSNPLTHSVDGEHSPVAAMNHHVLHVRDDQRVSVISELAAAPGRSIVFTRTKHGARKLTKSLTRSGVRAVEMHGDLSQAARTRNLADFTAGRAVTLVATDVAARGIHVDDIQLVIHADPPAEHKAYLHRSGRTARAGSAGTVVTVMTDQQRAQVQTILRTAKIDATTTRARGGDDFISSLTGQARPAALTNPAAATAGGQPTLPSGSTTGARNSSREASGADSTRNRRRSGTGQAGAQRRSQGRDQRGSGGQGRGGSSSSARGSSQRGRSTAHYSTGAGSR